MKWQHGILALLFPTMVYGQSEDIDLENFAERVYQVQDDDLPYEQIYESLLQYYIHPINLNKTTPDQLLSLNILSPLQINHFFDHIRKNGALLSIYELQGIPLFTPEIIRDLLPFVTVEEQYDGSNLWRRITSEENNYLLLRYSRILESKRGFQDNESNRYLGDPGYMYARYRVSRSNDFSIGFTLEKDAGERLFVNDSSGRYLFDFQSYHFFLKNKEWLKTLAIGDYQVQHGQGLVFGSGFSFGKGAETIHSVRRNDVGIRPYGSALESGFFRGVGITLGNDRLSWTAIYSSINNDANIIQDTSFTDFDEYVSSIQSTGFHRNARELSGRDQINERVYGGALTYKIRQLTMGSTFLYNQFSLPVKKRPNNYNQFEFSGTDNWAGSLYGSLLFQNFNFFGEFARSASGGQAWYGGLIASLTPTVDFSFSLRNYDRDFHSFYANAFGEQSRTINEKGAYWGLKFQPYRKLTVTFYYDHFEFPWLRYRVNSPSKGQEYLGRITYHVSRKIIVYAQYREETKGISVNDAESNFSRLVDGKKRNILLNADYELNPSVSMKTRIQTSGFSLGRVHSSGYAVIQDLRYKLWRFTLDARLALFDTDNYDNRIYAFERDLLYTFSIPAYSGNGLRSYLMMKYTVNRSLSLWIKYSRFTYQYQDSIGSGTEEITGPVRSDLRTMLRISF